MNHDGINFNLIRKPIRNINLRIGHDGSVNVSAPLRAKEKLICDFISSKKKWIIAHSVKIHPADGCFLYLGENVALSAIGSIPLTNYYQESGQREMTQRYEHICATMNIRPKPSLVIKPLKGKYGYYSRPKDTVCLNTALIAVPVECIDYVIIHELVHTIHYNHSKDFHMALTSLVPNHKSLRKTLSQYVIFNLFD